MATRGWGQARKFAKGGTVSVPTVAPKPLSPKMGLNLAKTHHTSTSAINLPHTQRAKWNKLG
jgi:hypothetical protein